jgi:4-hydroxy-tetrahydrodipicolinate reductase
MAKSSKTKALRAKVSGGKIAAPAIPRPTPDNSRLKSALRIGVVGCAGRMGQMLVRAAAANERCLVVGGVERAGSSAIGRDVGALAGIDPLGVPVGADAGDLFDAADAVLEFTSPAATLHHAELAARHRKVHIVGTTGLEAAQIATLQRHAKQTAIVLAPNMSLGVNLLLRMVTQVARSLDPDWDIEIVEMHHRAKVDAPSGTALALGKAAAEGRGVALDRVSARGRDGMTGARRRGDIGFAVLRGGDVVGEHTVVFAADGERVEITHKATSREIFARGAIRAALWAQDKPPGFYSMADVLGLSS